MLLHKGKIALSAALFMLLCAVAPRPGSGADQQSYRTIAEEKGNRSGPGSFRLADAPDERFDVLHYLLDIAIDPDLRFISGSVASTILVTGTPLDSLFLHLDDTMAAESILVDGAAVPFLHANDRLGFALAGAAVNDTVLVRIHYHGTPVDQGLRFRSESVYNVSEPDMARNWFPCYDEPWDKATSEIFATVPGALYCASNGVLLNVSENLDGTKTFHWRTRYPLTTYSLSVAIAPYEIFSHWYRFAPADSMEMPYYVPADRLTSAMITVAHAPAMMNYFESRFGEYPFREEKYGTAAVQMSGAMENFTCTIIDRRRLDGTTDHDWVLAHEMAHSWFGNSVTMLDWPDIWLNEGFATYADALWAETAGGAGAYRDRMAFFRSEYFTEDAAGRYPTYDPDFLWGATVYEKGAWVLHMLRAQMGDTDFFEALRQYHLLYRYDSATTEQFRAVCESVAGADFSAFFDQWIYQAGYPEYKLSWSYEQNGGGYDAVFHLEQLQENAPLFTNPVTVLINTARGDTAVMWVPQSRDEWYSVALDAAPASIIFDPDETILKTYEEVASSTISVLPPRHLLVSVYPNPAGGSAVHFRYFLPRASFVRLDLFDVLGRRVTKLLGEQQSAFWNSVTWVPETSGGAIRSAVYFYRLRAGNEVASGKIILIR